MEAEAAASEPANPPDCLKCNLEPAASPSVSEDQTSTFSSDELSDSSCGAAASSAARPASSPTCEAEFIHPTVYCKIPDGVEVRRNSYGHGIFVTKHFKAGEIVYTGTQARAGFWGVRLVLLVEFGRCVGREFSSLGRKLLSDDSFEFLWANSLVGMRFGVCACVLCVQATR